MILIVLVAGFVLLSAALLNAGLINKGTNGELFFDDANGLYWYDPIVFAGWTADELEMFLSENAQWKQAGLSQISALISSLSEMDRKDEALTDIMGSATYILPNILSTWVGIIEPQQGFTTAGIFLDTRSSSNNLYVELYSTIEDVSAGINNKGQQDISFAILCGAWLYTENDPLEVMAPVPEPSTLFLIGTGLIGVAGIMKKSNKISTGHRR